jgi:hypothetical protein
MRPTPTMLTLAALLAMSANAETVLLVRVYDYTRLPDNTILNSAALARQIFQKAGVETEWVRCPLERGEEDRFPGCRKPASESDILLRILPRCIESRRFSNSAFGYALPDTGGLPAQHAYVFFDRVEQAARRSQQTARCISLAVLLAHVMAHEIGHLLLGTESHSDRGIMRARWSLQDLQEMELGQMVFLPEQAKLIRSRITRR